MTSDIPEGWRMTDLSALIKERKERNSTRQGGLLPKTSVQGVFKGQGLIPMREHVRADDVARYKVIHRGDFAYNPMRLNIGSIALWDGPDDALVSPDYQVFGCLDGSLDPEWLEHFRRGDAWQRFLGQAGKGSVRVRIYVKDLGQMHVLLPPIEEQKRIAAILTSLDEAIEAGQAVVAQLREVRRRLAAGLFTGGMPGLHTSYQQTEVGRVPVGWTVGRIDSFGRVDNGKAKDPKCKELARPYLRVANVLDGVIDTSDVLEMPFSQGEFQRYMLQPGDVLLNEGQSLELVGRCAMYRGEVGRPCAMQNALLRFRAGPGARPEFFEHYFRWCQQSGRFAQLATQTTSIAHLGLGRLAAMTMALPGEPEQAAIARVLGAMDELIRQQGLHLMANRALSDRLLTALLSGKVRV